MGIVTSLIGRDKYVTQVKTAANALIADEPLAMGGKELGLSPRELLCASLGACTCITLRMYADRKGMALDSVEVIVAEENEEGPAVSISRQVRISGALDEAQRSRLMEIADKCPIHQLLSNPIPVKTVAI